MKSLFLKELRHFFSSLTGYLAIGLFLLIMGLFLFIFPGTSIFNYGYATLDQFFELAPWVLLILVPAVTMRSLSDEFRSGTWELIITKPLRLSTIVVAKYFGALAVVFLSLLPTLLYAFTIRQTSTQGLIDTGALAGSYLALLLLAAGFTAIGIFASALSANPIIAFLLAAFLAFIAYKGFTSFAALPLFKGGVDYWLAMLGVEDHYKSMSRGVLTFHDLTYFIALTLLFLQFAIWQTAQFTR